MDRGENKSYVIQADQAWFCRRVPGHFSIAVASDRDTHMNNNRRRKRIYPSTALRGTCLSHGRKKVRLWRLRVTLDEEWKPLVGGVNCITCKKKQDTLWPLLPLVWQANWRYTIRSSVAIRRQSRIWIYIRTVAQSFGTHNTDMFYFFTFQDI